MSCEYLAFSKYEAFTYRYQVITSIESEEKHIPRRKYRYARQLFHWNSGFDQISANNLNDHSITDEVLVPSCTLHITSNYIPLQSFKCPLSHRHPSLRTVHLRRVMRERTWHSDTFRTCSQSIWLRVVFPATGATPLPSYHQSFTTMKK